MDVNKPIALIVLIVLSALSLVLNFINIGMENDYNKAKGSIIGAVLGTEGLIILVTLLLYERGVL